MSKPKVKVVIGANYGDEGKGLATDYFTQQAKGPVLNVLYNGGPQRGHTVEHKNGLRHIFHHFGSGFFSGASTYFDENFLVDPIKFNIEHCELLDQARYFTEMNEEEAIENAICFCHPNCRVITPWDAMANQILQKGNNTCGCGIWQTINRYNSPITEARTIKAMCEMSDDALKLHLHNIAWWTLFKIVQNRQLDLSKIQDALPENYRQIWFDEQLIQNFVYDIRQMASRVIFTSFQDIAEGNDTIIFEGGQGLGLNGAGGLDDITCSFSCKDLTPSDTGSLIPVSLCASISDDIEICYVTRTYVTRHGDGELPFECTKEELGINEVDITNQSNQFQGDLRYGHLSWVHLKDRIIDDHGGLLYHINLSPTLMITHANSKFMEDLKDHPPTFVDDCYISASPYSEEVEVWHS